jgi:LmbE family N-acetylglucosaminyl deacetylase
MQPRRTLIVAAHPDDEVLGCGGTIVRLREIGAPVRVVFLAEGITARYEPAQFEESKVRAEIERRNANSYKALDILGVPRNEVFIAQRYCCRLDQTPLIELAKEIERHIRDFKPEMLFCHAADDVNVDHRQCHWAALTAARPASGDALTGIFSFEVLSSTEWNTLKPFAPTAFVDISQGLDRKVSAMAAYEGEMHNAPHPRSADVIRALATYRGAQVGVAAAEGFSLVRGLDL